MNINIHTTQEYMLEKTAAMPTMTRDWALCRWLAKEYGVIGIPCSPFFSPESRHLGANYVRFAFCKTDETLEAAKERLSHVPHDSH
jgi:aspartate/methionine/tyrosine aminotransferase